MPREAVVVAALATVMLAAAGCDETGHRAPDGPSEPVARKEEAFSSFGVERLIPFRIIQTFALSDAEQRLHFANLQQQVAAANSAYHTAGVQFYIKEYKVCAATGNLHDPDGAARLWGDVQSDIQCALPGSSADAGRSETPRRWMDWSTVEFGDPSELIIWLRDTGNVHDAGGPWAGNYIHFQSSGGEDTAKLAHELTHTLGLAHTHAIAGLITHPDARDPETGQPFQWADFWDLVYKPGSPNTYYSNRASAVGQGVLKEIDQHDQGNCSKDAHNRLTCYACQTGSYPCGLSWELLQWPCTDPACGLKGLAFTYKTPDNPNASFAWGVNAGSYYHTGDFTSISDSGIRLVRKFLRYDTVLNAESGNDHAGDWNRTSRRGHLHNRQPAWMLDFDSDGKRDVAFWNPPTAPNVDGVFQYRLSNTQTWVTKSMGRLGDIPVLADYNGDGVTDLAVYIPGGGVNHDTPITTEAYWRYCPTDPSSPSTPCPDSSIQTYQFGWRGDIPLPGLDFDRSSATSHLAIFRPSQHKWVWGPVADFNLGTARIVTVGEATTTTPLPGLYDTDAKTDLVGYDTMTGKFHLVTSSSDWQTTIVRSFPPPSDAGTMPVSHAVPVPGMIAHRYTFAFPTPKYKPRLGLALWWPDTGNWNVMWNPDAQSTYSTCQWGTSGDVPLGGIGSTTAWLSAPSYSKMTVYRGLDYGGGGTFYFRELNNLTCGASSGVYGPSAKPRTILQVVADMTGDDYPEIFRVNQDNTGEVVYMTSESNYSTIIPVSSAGTHLSVLL